MKKKKLKLYIGDMCVIADEQVTWTSRHVKAVCLHLQKQYRATKLKELAKII